MPTQKKAKKRRATKAPASSSRKPKKSTAKKTTAPKKKASGKKAAAKSLAGLPVWYQPESPMGSAVRYVAALSPLFNWVGIYVLKGKILELGPFIGAKTDHTRIPVGRGVCGTAVAENRDMNVPDVKSHGNYLACSLETRSELVVLIKDRAGKILGQIDIDSHTPNAFGPEEEAAVKRVAEELGGLW